MQELYFNVKLKLPNWSWTYFAVLSTLIFNIRCQFRVYLLGADTFVIWEDIFEELPSSCWVLAIVLGTCGNFYRWILNWSLSMHWGCCSHDITNCSGCSAGGQYSQEHSRTHCGWSSSTSWLEQCLFFVSSQINNTPFSSTMELDDSVVLPLEFEMPY